MVKVRRTVAQTHTGTANEDWVFDTELVDTDDMFSAETTPTLLTINTSGVYQVFFSVYGSTTGGGLSMGVTATMRLGTNSITGHSLSTQGGLGVYLNAAGIYPLTAGNTLLLRSNLFVQAPDTITIFQVEMGAVWLGDLA
jgi:hypothetical protein